MADRTTPHASVAGSHSDGCCPSFTADDVYMAIAQGLVTYDLRNEPLSELERSRVYRDEPTLQFARRLDAPTDACDCDRIASIQPGHVISYDSRSYTITLAGKDRVTLAGDEGATELAISTLQALYENGQVEITAGNPTPIESTRSPFNSLSPDEVARAVKRGRALDLSLQDAATGISSRTLRRWRGLVRAAGADPVSRNLALVDKIRHRGNRNRKLPEQALSLIERIAAEVYNQPTCVNVASAYRSFVSACHASGLQPCSYRSFSLELQACQSIRKREGKRSAYQAAPIVWYLSAKDPIHGVRPFEYIHIDHTPLDIVLISGETKQILGRPWLSLAIDAESRAIVGFYLTFEAPSYRSCMMVLRDIVRRHGRMPSTLVTDNGAEFRSGAFQRVCELYTVTLRFRPGGHPRHGSVMERVFGTTHSQLIHNLEGNTKQLKNVRTVTKSVAPQRHAQWTLPALYGALAKYFHDIYGTEPHPAHGEAPELHLRTRLIDTGLRRHRLARLDRTFLIETCPPVDQSGERRVDARRGVKVNYLWYWTEAFRRPRIAGTSLPVRVDPWDARFCYVLLGHDWHQCVCKLATSLRRLTRVELQSYFEEMMQKRGVKKHELTPERVREWMHVLDKNAFDGRLQAQQAEARLIYDALGLTTEPRLSTSASQSSESASRALDLRDSSGISATCTQHDTATAGTDGEEDEYALY